MDELTKKKISMSMRGKKKSATHRKNISLSMRKLKMTKEHKEAIAEAMKISWIKRKKLK
jgi:hypothetical protein